MLNAPRVMLNTPRVMLNALPRPIFQVDTVIDVSLADVDDLIDCTHAMSDKLKKDYFYAHGVDYDNVTKYYNTVKQLNSILYPRISMTMQITQALKENIRILGVVILIVGHILMSNK